MDIGQKQFLSRASQQAEQAGHIFPDMAACEAALESGYGKSQLAIEGFNYFGLKQRQDPIYPSITMNTREFLNNEWVTVQAQFVKYPDARECFTDRMATLQRLHLRYPNYNLALTATSPIDYVTAVSKTWSTDPERAAKVIAIYNAWKDAND